MKWDFFLMEQNRKFKNMWKITKHRIGTYANDLKIATLVRELSEVDWVTTPGEFEGLFNKAVSAMPKTNSFSPDLMYKVTQRNLKSIEVWKLNVEGDFKYKMFTLDFIEPSL